MSRTVAPDATMITSTQTAASAIRRKTTGEIVRANRRGSAADTDPACTIPSVDPFSRAFRLLRLEYDARAGLH